MKNASPEMNHAIDTIVNVINRLVDGRDPPILVALDGGSGSGKSTLAHWIAEELDVTLVKSDDFFAADISDAEWEARTAQERAADAIDWRRLRTQAIEPLLAGVPAKLFPPQVLNPNIPNMQTS